MGKTTQDMLDRLITECGRLFLVLRSTARDASPSPPRLLPPSGAPSLTDISQAAEGRQSAPRGVSVGALRDIPQQWEALTPRRRREDRELRAAPARGGLRVYKDGATLPGKGVPPRVALEG